MSMDWSPMDEGRERFNKNRGRVTVLPHDLPNAPPGKESNPDCCLLRSTCKLGAPLGTYVKAESHVAWIKP